jgi:hypothetical protein
MAINIPVLPPENEKGQAGLFPCIRKNNIPVIGLPLNANRCARWFGNFFPNSVDLDELEKLVSDYNGN